MARALIHGSELRQLSGLLAAILKDPDLTGELSFIEKEYIQGSSTVLQRLLPLVELRDLQDSLNES